MIRSYLNKLEQKSGGTLKYKKGTYSVTNTLFIPSNVTIILEDGVMIKKGKKTGVKGMQTTSSIFQTCSPASSGKTGTYSKYNGDKNIKGN